MKVISKYLWVAVCLCCSLCFLEGCHTRLQTTSVSVTDANRHYYPIRTGQKLALDYELKNTGDAELIISEIQTTCGCITVNEGRKVVPSGRSVVLKFEYDSSKNIGYVSHEILLYGNFDSTSVYRLTFDVNVVPHADYTQDYEELYEERQSRFPLLSKEHARDRKNYYVDSVTKDQ